MESFEDIAKVAQLIPSHTYLLTAAFEDIRCGVLTRWVQQCGNEPPSIIVAIERGSPIEPLVRDGRCFALCRVDPDDRHILRRFSEPALRGEDPFLALPSFTAVTGAPIVERAQCYFDCELIGHLAPESDTRLYIGAIRAAGVLDAMPDEQKPDNNGKSHKNGSACSNGCNGVNGTNEPDKATGIASKPQ